jgi:GDP-4-dehydro-6-deoxy-D-mannose reductase
VRILVTGAAGFVGSHLVERLRTTGNSVTGFDIVAGSGIWGDITDPYSLGRVPLPDVVFHLAAQSIPAIAAEKPIETVRVNTLGTAMVLQAFRGAKIVVASSADVYGAADGLVNEDTVPHPRNVYAQSKLAAEAFCGEAVVLRPVNQIGPRQRVELAASSFAWQIARAEYGGDNVIRHGDLDARRDFIDVRDMAEAYYRAMSLAPGIYVVGGGVAVSIGEVLRTLLDFARVPLDVRADPARMRPGSAFAADSGLFRAATDWTPKIPIETSLRDLLDHWRAHFQAAPQQAYVH